jgi:hypothetical protein
MNIDINLEDERNAFEIKWKNNLSFIPPMDTMSQTIREKLKEFTFNVFMNRMNKDDMEEIAEQAYEDGYIDGKIRALDKIKERFPNLIEEIEQTL